MAGNVGNETMKLLRACIAGLTLATALSGCSGGKPAAPIAVAPPPSPVVIPRPEAPTGYASNFVTPRDAAGRYVTPADGIAPAEALWHVRAGLNVAALACRQSDLAPAYNAMLSRFSAAFAAADGETKRLYRERFGAEWQKQHDTAMTRLYNWYAQPFAHAGFCQAAADALTEAQTLAPENAATFATTHLAYLSQPFLDGYRRWDDYKVAEADWLSRKQAPQATLKLGTVAAAR